VSVPVAATADSDMLWSKSLAGLVGKAAPALQAGLGITTVGQLLDHVPRRYAARGELTPIRNLAVGEHVTVLARVETAVKVTYQRREGRGAGRRRPVLVDGRWTTGADQRLDVVITDGQDRLRLAFFRQVGRHLAALRPGRRVMFAGQVSEFRGSRQLVHPEYEPLVEATADEPADSSATTDPSGAPDRSDAPFAGSLLPLYPASAKINSWQIADCVKTVLGAVEIADPVPARLLGERRLPDLATALRWVHRPSDRAQLEHGLARLRYDDALLPQILLAQRRADIERTAAVPRPPVPGGLRDRVDAQLPFALTSAQAAVGRDLDVDLARPHPMRRLLQGEVGSGKTVVALRAMLTVVDAGGQAVLLAPTEALATQHHQSLLRLLGPLGRAGMLDGDPGGTRVALLTGSLAAPARRATLLDIASGAAGLVVGTHALLQDRVQFAELGLVVVDEQHRFGVDQRAALTDPGQQGTGPIPHQLVMTATPIPRTVALTTFGDLAVSTLDQIPAGRAGVQTTVVPVAEQPRWVERTWARVVEEVRAGHQGFVVCPRIGDHDGSGSDDPGRRRPTALLDLAGQLQAGPLAGLRTAVLHARLPSEQRETLMRDFAAGTVDVLLATTVIEVGIDVPNATVMVVVDAERFGMSQLHQLRGRVGRGPAPGVCLLLTEAAAGSPPWQRVQTVAATTDGYALARADLIERREGDLLGTSQSGTRSSFRVLSVLDDVEVIDTARADAVAMVDADPQLASHPLLREHVRAAIGRQRADLLDQA